MINWKNNLQIYIDPSLKAKQKDLCSLFETEFLKYHAHLFNDLSDNTIKELPTLYIVDDLYEQMRFTNNHHFIVLVEKSNLDMFAGELLDIPHFKLDPTCDVSAFIDDILLIMKHKINAMAHEKVRGASENLKNIFAKKNLSELLNENKVTDLFKNLELELYQLNDLSDVQIFINSNLIIIKNELKLCDLKELIEQDDNYYLPLGVSTTDYLFLSWSEKTPLFIVQYLYTLLRERFYNQKLLNNSQIISQRWEQVFSKVLLPMGIFDKSGQLIIGNVEFSKLNISFSECRDFKDKEQVSIRDSLFRILRKDGVAGTLEFTFVPVDDFLVSGGTSSSSEELGIISSSIAHEINNPLAGILAAIDYLLLDEVSSEIENELKEMKAGVLRCKQLVNTFLGFSKLNRHLEFKKSEEGVGISDCLNMAQELLRFRLIENNIQMLLEHKAKGKFEQQINPHVLTIIIYLMLGDILTNNSHQSLVAGESKQRIKLVLEESEDQLIFHLQENALLSDDVFKSKLVKHLFEMTGVKCIAEDKMIFLKFN